MKNEKCKIGNAKSKKRKESIVQMPSNLSERFEEFAAEVIKGIARIQKNFAGRHIAGQLIRSATSAGANYEEACGAESRQDFIHKLQVVLKELRESLFWMRLSLKADLVSMEAVQSLLKEGNELANIIGKSVVTAKKRLSRERSK
jgi:four helix bundle protein